VTGLTSVNEKNVGVVRKFIDKLGKEMLATFDSYWAHGDQVRFGQITELRKVSLNAEKGGAEI
ncbi:MAG: hypothetical protein WCR30_01895, partial [Clostridia bacterium]